MALIVMAFVMLVGGNQSAYGGSTSATWTAANLVSEGTITSSGAATLASASVTDTLGVTGTTTLSDGLNLNNAGLCVNFYATSSATRVHLTASTTGTMPGSAAAVMTVDYGSCSY